MYLVTEYWKVAKNSSKINIVIKFFKNVADLATSSFWLSLLTPWLHLIQHNKGRNFRPQKLFLKYDNFVQVETL